MNGEDGKPAVLPLAQQQPRLILHADCTTCGRVNREEDDATTVVDLALDHTDGTGHVVVLNGTTDIPEEEQDCNAIVHGAQRNSLSIDEVLADPAASYWLRNALLAALSRDPADAANDAEVLARLLDKRCREILADGVPPGASHAEM